MTERGIHVDTLRPIPYINADAELVSRLRRKLALSGKRVCGITWRSQNAPYSDAKSMSLDDMVPVLSDPETIYVSLQYGDVRDEIENFRRRTGIEIVQCDEVDNFRDLDGHAALIEACDFVILVSNTTAHLAGALGKTGYVALPYARGMFFYWVPREEGRSYWYPSLRLFDQGSDGDWGNVMQKIAECIR